MSSSKLKSPGGKIKKLKFSFNGSDYPYYGDGPHLKYKLEIHAFLFMYNKDLPINLKNKEIESEFDAVMYKGIDVLPLVNDYEDFHQWIHKLTDKNASKSLKNKKAEDVNYRVKDELISLDMELLDIKIRYKEFL
jgi:hypothetical protein